MAARRTSAERDRASAPASALDRLARYGERVPGWLAGSVIGVLLAGAWLGTYASGGTQRAFTHLFYVPIVVSGVPFRARGAVLTALLATVLCGPLMPLDSGTGETQQVTSWVFRGVMFLVIGTLAYLATALHRELTERELSSEVQEAIALTGMPAKAVDQSLVELVPEVLAERRFHIVFQPVYSLADGQLIAVEALSRFDVEPYRTPDLWFAAAVAAGCGTELEIAAIEAAVAGAADLPPDVTLSVNASPATLGDQRLLEVFRACARPIVVEITEHAVVEDYHLLRDTVQGMRALGVRIAVDDAGAGISSLRHIVQLGPEVIKLDISLTQGVGSSALRGALAGALIEFAQRTDAQLIVEGIEELGDLSTWTALGADAVQGYLVGRPGALPVALHSAVITSVRSARV